MAELTTVPPWLVFFVGAALLAVVPRRVEPAVVLVVPALALVHVLAGDLGTSLTATYVGFDVEPLRVDALSRAFGVVFTGAAFLAGLYGLRLMRTGERAAALVYVGGALGVVYAGDLLTLFAFWEVKAVASALVVWAGGTPRSARAALRYLYVHLVGGTVLLAGVVVHRSATGSLAFDAFSLTDPGAPLILVGLAVGAAVVPLHAWIADAYPRASVTGTVFLSAFTTKAGVYALARAFPGVELLVWLGVIMALYGVIFAVLENEVRRLLSYHIVSQVGFMVAAIGLGTEMALNGATAHAFAHIIYKGLLLMGAGALLYAAGTDKLTELGGLARRQPLVLAAFLVGAFSISGVPLFSGFVSKELSIDAASLLDRHLVEGLLKLASVGTFLSITMKVTWFAWFGEQRRGRGPGGDRGPALRTLPASMLAAMGLAAAINVVLGVAPGLLYQLMPHPVDFTPYTVGHVSVTLQLLVFTGLGFWLLLQLAAPKAALTLDTDWVYRGLAPQAAAAAARLGTPGARLAPAWHTTTAAVRAGLGRLAPRGADPHANRALVVPTWLLGSVVLVVSVALLGIGLAR